MKKDVNAIYGKLVLLFLGSLLTSRKDPNDADARWKYQQSNGAGGIYEQVGAFSVICTFAH
jgi:hypothetical protein